MRDQSSTWNTDQEGNETWKVLKPYLHGYFVLWIVCYENSVSWDTGMRTSGKAIHRELISRITKEKILEC
jgi:hypothetical protein